MKEKNQDKILITKKDKVVGIINRDDMFCFLDEKLKQSLLIFEYIFDNIHEAICVIDKKGKVIIWNNNAEKLYNISKKNVLGKQLDEFFPNAINMDVLKTKKVMKNVYHTPKKGCNIVISTSPIFLNDKFIGVVSTDKDVSEIEKLSTKLKEATRKVEYLERKLEKLSNKKSRFIMGKSKAIHRSMKKANLAAKSNAAILILGESGTGKEVFARNIHEVSSVKGKFVPVNCGAIPSELFESEFFGYETGAFTGASRKGKAGYFELAKNGTLFLDEIGELPMSMQSKLLRAIQENRIKRLGAEEYITVNTRIISATNQDLEKLIKEKKFRMDLYYRLNVIDIELPPLRERQEDIILFVNFFLEKFNKEYNKRISSIDKELIYILNHYRWPGNIRELRNVIEEMVVLCSDEIITKDMIPDYILKDIERENMKVFLDKNYNEEMGLRDMVKNYEKYLIQKALKEENGNIFKAANKLKIPRSTLHYKINSHNDDVENLI